MKKIIFFYVVIFIISLVPLSYLVSQDFIEIYNIGGYLGAFMLNSLFVFIKKYFFAYCVYISIIAGTFMEFLYLCNEKRPNIAVLMNIKIIICGILIGICGEVIIFAIKKHRNNHI